MLIIGLSRVCIVFNAIDKCPEQEREGILGFITSIVDIKTPCHVKVFVTSRREINIVEAFENKHFAI